MFPILFHLGPITIYSLGFLLAIGFFTGSFIFWRRLRDQGYDEEKVIDFILLSGLVSLVFARLFFIIENFSNFPFSLANYAFFLRYPGLSFWGGLFGLFLVLWRFTKKERWNFWKVSDELTFGLLPLLAISQLGSFFDGSGVGRVTGMPWGIYFPGSFLKRQPTTLFYAILLMASWFLLMQLERRWRFWRWYRSKANGLIFLLFAISLFLINFILAFSRDTRVYFYWLEIFLSMSATIAAAVVLYYRSGRKLKEDYGKSQFSKKHS